LQIDVFNIYDRNHPSSATMIHRCDKRQKNYNKR